MTEKIISKIKPDEGKKQSSINHILELMDTHEVYYKYQKYLTNWHSNMVVYEDTPMRVTDNIIKLKWNCLDKKWGKNTGYYELIIQAIKNSELYNVSTNYWPTTDSKEYHKTFSGITDNRIVTGDLFSWMWSMDDEDLEKIIYKPILQTSKLFYVIAVILVGIIALGAYALYLQLTQGLVVTGMDDTVFWGVYMVNLIFFLGISYGGTLVSGILRMTGQGWRTPITRMAEAVTVCALIVAVPMIIIDAGRPERAMNILLYGRLESPILWDTISISTYLMGSVLFLYLSLIPDVAICRDKLTTVSKLKKRVYKLLALGWTGSKTQIKRLNKALFIIPIILVPVAISAHTALAWVFGVATRVGWHSTIFGPYFVVAAIFSGVAAIVVVMGILRKLFHLERFITLKHFKSLAAILLVLDLTYLYFTISEWLTTGYAGELHEIEYLTYLFGGQYQWVMYGFLAFGVLLPAFIIAIPKTATIKGIMVASVMIMVAMWMKRFIIVVSTLAIPQISGELGTYTPSWVEWAITAAGIAVFLLLYLIFTMFFPIISVWETKEEWEKNN